MFVRPFDAKSGTDAGFPRKDEQKLVPRHQGIRRLAPSLAVGALATDSLIEAFEGEDPSSWVVSVKWHPESEGAISLETQLLEAFTEAGGAGIRSKSTLSLG